MINDNNLFTKFINEFNMAEVAETMYYCAVMHDSRVLLVVRALLFVWIGLFSIGCYWLLRLKVQIGFFAWRKSSSPRAVHAYCAHDKIYVTHTETRTLLWAVACAVFLAVKLS